MAYTEIHKITATINAALDYISGDKVEEITEEISERVIGLEDAAGNSLSESLKNSLDYALNDKEGTITFKTYTSYNCCFPIEGQSFTSYIIDHSNAWSKEKENDKNRKETKDNKEVIAWHLIQSFEESIRPEIANEIGRKLVDRIIPDYPCQISTHTNTNHTHNHIILSAWNMEGKKFHNDHNAVDMIRKVSDELCEEYNLHVLENTKEMKLIKYQDADGNLHYYEPTDRKNEMIRQRDSGKASKDDVNSYRNTVQYEEKESQKESVRSIVKRDIDNLIPQVSSFESLLQRLREMGYKIRDKKKNGEWLAYVTYTPPTAERGVRDYTLSNDGYYKRDNLERIIAGRAKEQDVSQNNDLKYFDEYVAGEFDPYKDLDENVRLDKDSEHGTYAKRRTVVEREVIRDIRKVYSDNNINYKELFYGKGGLTKRERELLAIIKFRCDCLSFVEKKDIKTFDSIQERINNTYVQLDKMNTAIATLRTAVAREKKLITLPEEIEKLSYKIAANKKDEGYMATEYSHDVQTINAYKKQLQRKGLITPEKITAYEKKVLAAEVKLHNFEAKAELMNREVETYNYFNSYVTALGQEYNKIKGNMSHVQQKDASKTVS